MSLMFTPAYVPEREADCARKRAITHMVILQHCCQMEFRLSTSADVVEELPAGAALTTALPRRILFAHPVERCKVHLR